MTALSIGTRVEVVGAIFQNTTGTVSAIKRYGNRLNYAVRSFDYLRTPVGSGTFRYGLNRFVTLEGHAEGGAGVLQGGAGALFNLFDRASLDASLAGSKGAGGAGLQIAVSARTAFMGLMFEVASQRTFRAYSDLAAVTTPNAAAAPGAAAGAFYVATSAVPPRAYDRFSVAVPNLIGNASFNLSLVNLRQADGARSRIGSVGFSKSLPHGVALNANAYADLTHKGGYGAFAGINVQFGGPLYLNHQAGLQNGALTNYSEVGRGAGQEAWTYGWRAFDAEGAGRYSGASGTLMTPLGRASVSATQYGFGKTANAVGTGEFSGSLAMVGAAVAAGPATGESFALVKTGAAGVTVLQDNRVLGVTGPLGTMLVPNLRPFQDNKIGIDPASLPGNAVAAASELILRPKSGSGVGADFAVNADPRDAEVILVDIAGKPIGAGALAKLQGQPNGQTVGYDGRVYFTGLASHNVIEVRRDGAACSAGFDYAPRKGGGPRPTIGPVACR